MHLPQMIEYSCDQHSYPHPDHVLCHKQFSIHEHLCVPEGKPDIEDILEVSACPHIDMCKIIHTPFGKKIVIMGRIEQKILYVADVSCQSVHFFHTSRPFCTFIEIPHTFDCCSQHRSVSECSSKSHHPDPGCYPAHHCPPSIHPRIMVEYLCAQKVGPREISKCLILVVWFSKHDHHPHPHHPHPHQPWSGRCGESPGESNCSSCRYAPDCVRVKRNR